MIFRIRRLLGAKPGMYLSEQGSKKNPLDIIKVLAVECFHGERRLALPEIVKLLVNAGADVNVVDENGCTPLKHLITEVHSLLSVLFCEYLHLSKLSLFCLFYGGILNYIIITHSICSSTNVS